MSLSYYSMFGLIFEQAVVLIISLGVIFVIVSSSLPIKSGINSVGPIFLFLFMFVKLYQFSYSIATISAAVFFVSFAPYLIELIKILRKYNKVYEYKTKLVKNKINLFEEDTRIINLSDLKL